MNQVNVTTRGMVVFGAAAIAIVVLLIAAAFGGCYYLALHALHNRSNLSVAQACEHWRWIYTATVRDATPALRSAVARTLVQLKCTP